MTSNAATPFDRAHWFALLAAAGQTPLIVCASDGETTAAMALCEDDGRIAPLRNWYAFIWRPMVPPGPAGDALLIAMARDLKRKGWRATFEPVPGEDDCAARLAHAFRVAGWQVRMDQCDVNHFLRPCGRSFSEYWETRPGTLRTTLKRKGKKVETEISARFDPAIWAEYEAIYAASWKPGEDHPAMLRAFAMAEGQAGRLRLGVARAGGVAVAAQCWTVENSVAYIHKLAHLESHRHLSAGTTLSAAMFAHAIDGDRAALIDFGTGDERYKRDWMEEVRPRYRIDCLDPAQVRSWAPLAKRLLAGRPSPPQATLARAPLDG